jgi:hypothetical protein
MRLRFLEDSARIRTNFVVGNLSAARMIGESRRLSRGVPQSRGSTLGQPGSQALLVLWLIALRQFALWIAQQFRHVERPDSMHDRNQNGTRPPHRS